MYFEEFYVGQQFDVNPVSLSAEQIHAFALEYDPQPIHIDKEFAEEGLFKGIIASGLHTLSAIWGEWIRSNRFGTEIIGGTSLDFVNWKRPVRPGDTLYTVVEVVQTTASPNGKRGLVTIKFTATNQQNDIVLETQGNAYLKSQQYK